MTKVDESDTLTETQTAYDSERESLEFELEQAREDDRDSWSRTWQAIVAGVTAIAIVLAMYTEVRPVYTEGKEGVAGLFTPALFLALVLLVTVASYSYVASTAVISTLRYQFMRDIENRLIAISGKEALRWKHLSSAVETYNIFHLNSNYAVAHYANLVIAVVATTGFLAVTIFIFLCDIKPNDNSVKFVSAIILTLFSLSVALFIATVMLGSFRTKEMYEDAKQRMKRRIALEQDGIYYETKEKGRNAIWAALYYIYPRPMDFAKTLYIVLGVILGGAVSGALTKNPIDLILKTLLALFVFDGLVYQARYQWNDIRGAAEDDNNPEATKRARLPKDIVGLHSAVVLSIIFGVFKLVVATEIIVFFNKQLEVSFAIACVLVFVLAFFYEVSRAKNCVPAVVFLVTLGYPLRVFAGLSVGLAAGQLALANVSSLMLCPILLAAAAFGLSFVGITWALEGCDHVNSKSRNESVSPDTLRYKGHVMWMYSQVGVASVEEHPLRPRGRIFTAWNVGIVLSVLLMCAYLVYAVGIAPIVVIICLLYIAVLMYGLLSNGKRLVGLVLTIVILIALFVLLCLGKSNSFGGADKMVILFTIGAYLAVYLSFRAMNYKEMTSALESLGAFNKALSQIIQSIILGKETMEALENKSNT